MDVANSRSHYRIFLSHIICFGWSKRSSFNYILFFLPKQRSVIKTFETCDMQGPLITDYCNQRSLDIMSLSPVKNRYKLMLYLLTKKKIEYKQNFLPIDACNSWEELSDVTLLIKQVIEPSPLPLWELTSPESVNFSVTVRGASMVCPKDISVTSSTGQLDAITSS